MDLKYIESAMIVADHGIDCDCTHCQIAIEILSTEVSPQTKIVAQLASLPIARHRAEGIRLLTAERTRWDLMSQMTDIEYQSFVRSNRPQTDI